MSLVSLDKRMGGLVMLCCEAWIVVYDDASPGLRYAEVLAPTRLLCLDDQQTPLDRLYLTHDNDKASHKQYVPGSGDFATVNLQLVALWTSELGL